MLISWRKKIRVSWVFLVVLVACNQTPSPQAVEQETSTGDPAILTARVLASPGGLEVISSKPAANSYDVFPGASISLEFSSSVNGNSAQAAISLFVGRYDPNSNPSIFTKLNLTSMCDGQWRVRNPNGFPVSFNWDVYKTPERGVGVVPPNADAYFQSSTGQNTVRLYVGTVQQSVKAANNTKCSSQSFPVSVRPEGKTLIVSPNRELGSGEHTLVVSTLARFGDNTQLAQPFVWVFHE